jgi:cytochrome c5
MFMIVLGALVAFTVIIIVLANVVGSGSDAGKGVNEMQAAAIAERIKPVARVNVGAASTEVAAAPAAARSGKEVFGAVCTACHSTGAAGAPKVGDKAAWEPRVAQGMDALMHSAINGKGAMPPRGGNPAVTDEELKATIEYMLKETGL